MTIDRDTIRAQAVSEGAERLRYSEEWDTDRWGEKWTFGRFPSKLTGAQEITTAALDTPTVAALIDVAVAARLSTSHHSSMCNKWRPRLNADNSCNCPTAELVAAMDALRALVKP